MGSIVVIASCKNMVNIYMQVIVIRVRDYVFLFGLPLRLLLARGRRQGVERWSFPSPWYVRLSRDYATRPLNRLRVKSI